MTDRPVTLPGLGEVPTDPVSGVFLGRIKEHLEVWKGDRAGKGPAVVTWRDLASLGLVTGDFSGTTTIGRPTGTVPGGGVLLQNGNGTYQQLSVDDFVERIKNSQVFRDLMKGLNDPTRFDSLPEAIRGFLLADLEQEARSRGADIRRLETKLQGLESVAVKQDTITAAVEGAVAGVRQTAFAYAAPGRAAAGIANQVKARLDDVAGEGVTLEEVMYGTASYAGVMGQWTMKINANGVMAGVALMASNTADGPDSAFLIQADRLAFVASSYSGGPTVSPDSIYVPFGVDASGVYIKGNVRIDSTTTTLADLSQLTGVTITASSEFFKVDSAGAAVNTSITLLANLTGGLTGTVTWSHTTGYSGSTPSGTNSWTVNAADQTADAVTYTATKVVGSDTYVDSWTIVRLKDGADALTPILVGDRKGIPSDADGANPIFAGATGQFQVYRGATRLTSGVTYAIASGGNPAGLVVSINGSTGAFSVTGAGTWPANSMTAQVTFEATVGSTVLTTRLDLTKERQGVPGPVGDGLTAKASSLVFKVHQDGTVTPASITVDAVLVGVLGPVTWQTTTPGHALNGQTGLSKTIYARSSDGSPSLGGADSLEVTISAGDFFDTFTLLKLYDGSDALNLTLSNESATLAADPDGSNVNVLGASCTMTARRGSDDISADGWLWTATAGPGVTFSGQGTRTVQVSNMTVDQSFITLYATKPGIVLEREWKLTRVRRGQPGAAGPAGANGPAGSRGALELYKSNTAYTPTYTYPGSSPGLASYKAAANAEILAVTGSATKVQGDRVTFYSGTTNLTVLVWRDFDWTEPGIWFRGDMILDGSLSVAKLTAGTLTGFTIQTNASGARLTLNDAGNANQIVGYDAGNIERFRLNGSSGAIVAAGAGDLWIATSSSGAPITGQTTAASSPAIKGRVLNTSSSAAAVSGETSGTGFAVSGTNTSGNAGGGGVMGATWTSLAGVYGVSNANSGAGVRGVASFGASGVRGDAASSGHGVYGAASGSGAGVKAVSTGAGVALHAEASGTTPPLYLKPTAGPLLPAAPGPGYFVTNAAGMVFVSDASGNFRQLAFA